MVTRHRPAAAPSQQDLRSQLDIAITAASDAYRHSSRLIRVLTVLGKPSSPAELVEETLLVLSEVFSAELVLALRVTSDRLLVTGSCGTSEDDPVHVEGLPIAGAAAVAATRGRVVSLAGADLSPEDVPPTLEGLVTGSAVWVPVGAGEDRVDELLVLYRCTTEPFTPTEVQIIGSVASRLRLAVESRERSAALEQLARSGHRLASVLDLEALQREATQVLPQVADADRAELVLVDDPDPGRPGWETACGGAPFRGTAPDGSAVLAAPVVRDGSCMAVLYAYRRDGRTFSKDALESATVVATSVAAAMSNAELYRALAASEASLRLITDSISDMVAVVDGRGLFAYASPSHERALGHTVPDLLGRAVLDLVHPDDQPLLRTAIAQPMCHPRVEYRVRTRPGSAAADEGTWRWVESALRPAPGSDTRLVLSSRVVDERRRLEEELRHRAMHDPLTGLANRTLTADWLEAALAREADSCVGVLFCDLDKFKEVNDRLGHEAGDELLVQVADRLRGCVRGGDLLARFGGDEFVIALDGVCDHAEVEQAGQRVVSALSGSFLLRGEPVEVTASIGGVLGSRRSAEPGALLRDADAAMYAAKGAGRGGVQVFDEAASRRALDRLELRSDLAHAVARDELVVHYQPLVDLLDGAVLGFEALVRWLHPVRGLVPPDQFIPVAEETGLIADIGTWVLDEACRQLAEWQAEHPGRALRMSVNVSAAQLHDPTAAARYLQGITAAGVQPRDVWLEVTEHSSVRSEVSVFAHEMHRSGVRFALDDFGTAYSNLGDLTRLPVEALKIDRLFVSRLTADRAERGLVQAVLAVARSLDLQVVAEGVETQEQREELLALGCRQAQGYLFSRPVPAEAAAELLRTGTGMDLVTGR
ncbi:putative bifunctional diguanylate cyclase/phosphodiesterase [Cellulomonas bogoriensis]|uniref:Diguanylate cyclase n=1 Tax=Cellulomonas bogoriensis 69B4 = DSM 16987 TaxID=1386082 RepID=A0A0A0C0P0_9CELL|nr:EAL domain-containing protein [Cellulomonas bogoriensis]KGM13537.1 hypothetical protein N869_13315 [Cellulomonas bogoriensis 69B4 = DSM 16987]